MSFQLAHGIEINNIDGLEQGYSPIENGFVAVFSCENLLGFVSSCIKKFDEPMFFFLELPCSEDEEKKLRKADSDHFHYKLYYLDNCTKNVIKAIIKRYGDMLANDGMCRFGFGSHSGNNEIYIKSYKVVNFYSADNALVRTACEMADKLGAIKTNDLVTAWDLLSEENPSNLSIVEFDGETVFDIPDNLESEGMYYSDTIV